MLTTNILGNIEVLHNEPNFYLFRTSCTCLDKNHSLDINCDIDTGEYETFIDINMCFGVSFDESFPYKATWYESFWHRLKTAFKIITGQEVSFEAEFGFKDEKHLQDFVTMLVTAYTEIEKRLKEKELEKKNNEPTTTTSWGPQTVEYLVTT
jgi:hypothetical protein